MPVRIQRRRVKGWRMPPDTVYVGRPSKWGNPFTVERALASGQCKCPMCRVVRFEYALSESGKKLIRDKLAGKDLACWCPLDRPCHADILLAIANGWPEPRMPTP